MLLFKYLSPDGAIATLSDGKCIRLKFSLPEDFNDPYELFLEPDPAIDEREELAFYKALLGKIPRLPTTCFSRTPESVTMWAHYGRNQTGACLVIEEDALVEELEAAIIDNVEYSSDPAQVSTGGLRFAMNTMKNRHARAVLAEANRAAYFRKREEWSYEQERRCIVSTSDLSDHDGHLITELTPGVLRGVIVGHRCGDNLRESCRAMARVADVPTMTYRNGLRGYKPFFESDEAQGTYHWNGAEFIAAILCSSCGTPFDDPDTEHCEWCSLTNDDLNEARQSSSYFIFNHLGIQSPAVEFAGLMPRGKSVQPIDTDSKANIVPPRPPLDDA